jgi:hypothetical protein
MGYKYMSMFNTIMNILDSDPDISQNHTMLYFIYKVLMMISMYWNKSQCTIQQKTFPRDRL